jgi:hypothetical protein
MRPRHLHKARCKPGKEKPRRRATLIGVVDKHTFWGRTRVPLIKKLNPIWWFRNDTEQSADEAPWYHPDWSRARRYFYWNFLRNPLQNFRCFIIGVQDRNYAVTGRYPVLTIQRDDLVPPEYGFQCSVIWLRVPRPFVSYSGKYVVWYVGTQPTGIFGLKFNLHLSRHSLPDQSIVSPV